MKGKTIKNSKTSSKSNKSNKPNNPNNPKKEEKETGYKIHFPRFDLIAQRTEKRLKKEIQEKMIKQRELEHLKELNRIKGGLMKEVEEENGDEKKEESNPVSSSPVKIKL